MPRSSRAEHAPRIGVSGPVRGGLSAWWLTKLALTRAGARAVRLVPGRAHDLERLDGLVLGGGADVSDELDPLDVPEPPSARIAWQRRVRDWAVATPLLLLRLAGKTENHGIDRARDALERALIAHAAAHDLPVLGICRGAQLMNLAAGGSLARNLHTLYEERPHLYTVLPRREVVLVPGSRLAALLACRRVYVNSLHFHAVEAPGRGLRISAREASGVAQGIEHPQRRFWIGVQWHPEYLPQHGVQQRLFSGLVAAARSQRGRLP